MTAPPRSRRIVAAGGVDLEAEVRREVAQIQREHVPVLPTGRCRICQHPESRKRVNTLLGYGLRDSEILEYIQDINDKRPKNGKITRDSINNHKRRHFRVQDETKAGFRRILERRKAMLAEEHEDASVSLLSGLAYLDVVAQKGWQHLINDETIVDYETGLKAQLRLEELQREGQQEEQVAQMRRDVALLHQAVRDVAAAMPDGGEQIMRDITERIDELTGESARRPNLDDDEIVDVEVVDDFYDRDDDDDVGVNPVLEADTEDPLGED